ncbi:MAG TPA: DUF1003 domain-containing protein [Caulobacteraceae bacterium]|nr:DUF1003 domain-containing protein [Caulobacteraceae bacterium]
MSLVAERQLSESLLGKPYEELTPIQKSVIDLVASENPSKEHPALAVDERTFWERLADHVAAIGGSWGFIFGFFVVLAGWVLINSSIALKNPFDPYPYIFLNLMLSMLAAIQAPVIMMSQNRAAAKDREAAEHDYIVNLRSELELMHLHDKLDAVRERELEVLIRGQSETIDLLKQQVASLEVAFKQHEAAEES